MNKSYAQKRIELHEKSLKLFKEAATKHVRLLEIEEQVESEEEATGEVVDYPDEHFDLTMELAHLMRDQVDISFQADELEENEEGSKSPLN